MLHWSLLGEYYSLFILIILFVRYNLHERNVVQTRERKTFVRCLTMSMSLICLNILCVYALEFPGLVPRWVNILLNTCYFEWCICVSSQFGYLLFETMLEHVYDKHCLRRSTMMLGIILSISTVLLIVNLFTGIVFYIDGSGIYHRGILNRAYYALLLAQVFFLGVCYVRNRSSISDKMIYVVKSLPPLVIVLCVLQVAYPDVLMNGTISALVSLVIFIAFRSHTVEQDSLTGAGSRKALMDELALRSGSHQSVQIIQLSITNLADHNLRYSHGVGDALLYEVSHYLQHCGENIKVYRSGSATFTILRPLEQEATAEGVLQLILQRMEKDWIIGECDCRLSFAVAEMRSDDLVGSPSEIIERLEYTMVQAKENPPLARFDSAVSEQLCRRVHLTELIRRSIDQRRFQVVYQPIYCCHRDVFCSAEALLRLADDDGTPVPPDVFIPIAEECGMTTELTSVVLEAICETLSSGRFPRLESVAINLSTRQLMDTTLPEKIRTYLKRYHIAPNQLKLEMTEQFVLNNAQYAREQMTELVNMGLDIYMDDFGTGYSNLSSILHFPFSFVKLDRSLITPVAENEDAAIMVRALQKLFRNLNKRVIMEGVETAEQVAFLRSIGADMIQGYYYAKPMPVERLGEFFGPEEE